MSRNNPLSLTIEQIERYLDVQADAAGDLRSHRTGMQFALFAIVAAVKLSPDFNIDMLRQFAQTALDSPPEGFEGDAVFSEPLTLLLALTKPDDEADSVLGGALADVRMSDADRDPGSDAGLV